MATICKKEYIKNNKWQTNTGVFEMMHILPCRIQERWRGGFTENKNLEFTFRNELLGVD